jgi:hypothetical protein
MTGSCGLVGTVKMGANEQSTARVPPIATAHAKACLKHLDTTAGVTVDSMGPARDADPALDPLVIGARQLSAGP